MTAIFAHEIWKKFRSAIWLALFIGLLLPSAALAEEPSASQQKTFPGINELIPRASALAARVDEADNQIPEENERKKVYRRLEKLTESLRMLEEQYSNWEDVNNWRLNILLRAQSDYADLDSQEAEPSQAVFNQLQTLEALRFELEEQKKFWKEWQAHLRKANISLPKETIQRTLSSIDTLLERIHRVGAELVQAQQKHAPAQEIMASRLNTISQALNQLRLDTFRRNTYSMFEADYYRQFDRDIWADFKNNLAASMRLPTNFFQRHGITLALQAIGVITIALLLLYRRRTSKAITAEWGFLFERPLSGGFFITLVFMGTFTELTRNMPLNWKWMTFMAVTIAAMRLLNAFYDSPRVKAVIRVIAIVFLFSEALRYFGLPVPLLQLYDVLLCALAIPFCLKLLRTPSDEGAVKRLPIYLLLGVSIIALLTALVGNESLATNLLDATLTTFIIIIITRMALRLCDRGIEAVMGFEWVKERHFMQVLGQEAGIRKLQRLVRVIILFNTALLLLINWMVFDTFTEAREVLSSLEYTIGDFTISVKMIVMVIVILYLTTLFSWVTQAFIDSQIMTPKKMDIGVKESLKKLTHYGLFTVGFLIAISMAGIDLQKFTIMAGALGVGIGFGLQNIVNNFVSGLILLFERPVKVGDTINIDENWGTITKIGLRSTVFETFDRSEIIVPNADLISLPVTNWTFTSKVVRVLLPVGVAYGSPLQEVLGVLNRAAREHEDVLTYPEPSTVFDGFGESSIDFTLRFWVHTIDDRMVVRTEVAVIVDRLLRENDIEIPFPQRDLHLRSVDSNLQTSFGLNPAEAPQTTDTLSTSDTCADDNTKSPAGRKSSEVPQATDTPSEPEGSDE